MRNNKQSSVEFFWDELKTFLPAKYTVDESVKILSILKQAKAMHKEEIINATIYGDRFEGCYGLDSDQYYEKTFGGNNEP